MKQYSSVIYGKGKTTIPHKIRELLKISDGAEVIYTVKDGNVILENENDLVGKLKKMVQKCSKGKSLVDELIKDRKNEAMDE